MAPIRHQTSMNRAARAKRIATTARGGRTSCEYLMATGVPPQSIDVSSARLAEEAPIGWRPSGKSRDWFILTLPAVCRARYAGVTVMGGPGR